MMLHAMTSAGFCWMQSRISRNTLQISCLGVLIRTRIRVSYFQILVFNFPNQLRYDIFYTMLQNWKKLNDCAYN